MKLQDKFVRRQLELMNSIADNVTLATARRVQNSFFLRLSVDLLSTHQHTMI